VWKNELVLRAYLPRFAQTGQTSTHRTFIDCYAGSVSNVERGTGRPVASSTDLAFTTDPPFTHLLLFEIPDKAEGLRKSLRARYPERRFNVMPGDVNTEIRNGLKWLRAQGDAHTGPHLGQAIAYLDPDNHSQLAWTTIEDIARFAQERGPRGEYSRRRPIELLTLFPTGTLRRQVPVASGSAYAAASEVRKATRLFGTDTWLHIYNDQRRGILKGDAGWRWYVELFRHQLRELGYTHVSAIETRNTKNVMQYHLVFASGHIAGRTIMKYVMEQASRLLPEKLLEDRERSKHPGQSSLFEDLHLEMEAIGTSPESYAALMNEPAEIYPPGSGSGVRIERPPAPKASGGRAVKKGTDPAPGQMSFFDSERPR
jgi:three-Cys-motif partner protein